MDLKDLLELKTPTVEQYDQMEMHLVDIARAATAEIERLDAEGLARGADRLLGRDDGGGARSAARAIADQRRTDAENLLSEVRGKSSALEARLEKEADERAWAEVKAILDGRIAKMNEIEGLCQQIGVLYLKVIKDGEAAAAKAPAKPLHRESGTNHLFGRNPAQIGAAIMAALHTNVGRPFATLAISNEQFSASFDKAVRGHGLAGFLVPLHNSLMLQE